MDRAATGKAFVCVGPTVARPQNRTDSLYQAINGLVGNVDWGQSLSVVACEFPGLNKFLMFTELLDVYHSHQV